MARQARTSGQGRIRDPGGHDAARTKQQEATPMGQRDHDKDQEIDQAGERGGDTGPSSKKGDGPGAERGDWRRDKPVHSGPTRHGNQGSEGKHGKRSGSDSNAS